MTATVALMVLMGAVGAIDSLYFHLYRFRLFRQPSARGETLLHLARAATYALALGLLSSFVPRGGWFWALASVFTLDLAIDVVDVLVEPASRAPLGGLPGIEYLLHMLVMAISGAIWASFGAAGWSQRVLPTALLPADGRPAWLYWDARLTALGSVALLLLEGGLFLSARRGGFTPPVQSARG
jgi:hypothetical protein